MEQGLAEEDDGERSLPRGNGDNVRECLTVGEEDLFSSWLRKEEEIGTGGEEVEEKEEEEKEATRQEKRKGSSRKKNGGKMKREGGLKKIKMKR